MYDRSRLTFDRESLRNFVRRGMELGPKMCHLYACFTSSMTRMSQWSTTSSTPHPHTKLSKSSVIKQILSLLNESRQLCLRKRSFAVKLRRMQGDWQPLLTACQKSDTRSILQVVPLCRTAFSMSRTQNCARYVFVFNLSRWSRLTGDRAWKPCLSRPCSAPNTSF